VHFPFFLHGALESVTVLRRLRNRRCIIIIIIIIIISSSSSSSSSNRRFVSRVYANASNALRYGSHSVTCKQHHICLYSPVAEHHHPLTGTHCAYP